jgi:hypothetical protein
MWASMSGDQKLASRLAKPPNERDWALMREMLKSGQVRPVIDRRYTLGETSEPLRYLSEGHARGKVVIKEGEDPPITTLTGTVDQAALHSMLRRLYSVGLPLLSVICVE